MFPVLRLGSVALPVGPFVLLAAFFIALEVGERAGRRRGLPKDLILNVGSLAVVVGILAARLAYVLTHLAGYQLDWSQIFAINLGTLDMGTGVLVGLLVALVYLQRHRVDLDILADALAPAAALALAIISFGNLLTGDAYGAPARDLPWAIVLWGEPRHPVQVYELVTYLAIFAFLWFLGSRPEPVEGFDGGQFLLAVAFIAGARVWLEPFRGDSVAWVAGLRSMQVLALLVMTGAGLALAFKHYAVRIERGRLTTIGVGLVMLLVGIVIGYWGGSSATPPSAISKSGTPSSAANARVTPSTPMAIAMANTRHFKGDANAPVTMIEFSDFQ